MAKAQPSAGRPRPVQVDPHDGTLVPSSVFGNGEPIRGALLFLAGIPLALWGLQASLGSPEAYASFAAIVAHPLAKLAALGLLWATLHHLFAGIRHLFLDLHIGIALAPARRSAAVVLVLALLVTLSIAIRTW